MGRREGGGIEKNLGRGGRGRGRRGRGRGRGGRYRGGLRKGSKGRKREGTQECRVVVFHSYFFLK